LDNLNIIPAVKVSSGSGRIKDRTKTSLPWSSPKSDGRLSYTYVVAVGTNYPNIKPHWDLLEEFQNLAQNAEPEETLEVLSTVAEMRAEEYLEQLQLEANLLLEKKEREKGDAKEKSLSPSKSRTGVSHRRQPSGLFHFRYSFPLFSFRFNIKNF
jgi:hypothetical protein